MIQKIIATLLILATLTNCQGKKVVPREVYLKQVSYHMNSADNYLEALETFRQSCRVIMKYDPDRPISKRTSLGGKSKDWQDICAVAMEDAFFTNAQAHNFFVKHFHLYQARDKNNSEFGKFTGYYEIILHGSRKKTKKYKYPIYGPPLNLERLKGTDAITHQAINDGALNGKGLEIAWTDSASRLFFMQIQGSGVLILDNGQEMKLGYAGQNGHQYVAIGPLMKNYTTDKIRSALDIINWLHDHPIVAKEIMEQNPSYVFFKELHGSGPVGAHGVALTPQRSIAIDHGLFPYGMPIWLETSLPRTPHYASHLYSRLFIAQDTGGAIRGPVRGDVFFGKGQKAEEMAGYMNQKGRYFLMFPKNVSVPAKYISKS